MVLNAFRRDREVVQLVPHWASCRSVAEVIVVWNDVGRPPPQPILDLVAGCNAGAAPDARVRLVRPPTNDIQNRWAVPTGGFRTAAVLNVDDDVKISCETSMWLRVAGVALCARRSGRGPRVGRGDDQGRAGRSAGGHGPWRCR